MPRRLGQLQHGLPACHASLLHQRIGLPSQSIANRRNRNLPPHGQTTKPLHLSGAAAEVLTGFTGRGNSSHHPAGGAGQTDHPVVD
jgi:hypothetical protein